MVTKKKTLKVTLIRSLNGRVKRHVACARGLGLRRMHHTVEVEDTPAVRGMILNISHLLKWEDN